MLLQRFRFLLVLFAALLVVPCSRAQQEKAPDGGASGMTLHVTVRELQVGALVLDLHRHAVPGIDHARFRLQVDADKPFAPTTVHRAGNDPISLAVILDLSQPHRFQQQFPEALASMREKFLLPHDHLLLFAVDCSLVSYRGETDTPDGVRKAVDNLVANPKLHWADKPGRTCENEFHLWDSAMIVLSKLASTPGRHAMLFVTDGKDTASVTPMLHLARQATLTATTLFALPYHDMVSPNVAKSPLEILVAKTGGQLLDEPRKNDLALSLADCVGFLRERYILSFNQPQHAKPGEHAIQASVQHSSYTVRTSGVTVPLAETSGVTTTEGQDPSKDDPVRP